MEVGLASWRYARLRIGDSAASKCTGSGDMITVGDAKTSIFYEKISPAFNGQGGNPMVCGSTMPLGETPLGSDDVALIKNWINEGANP